MTDAVCCPLSGSGDGDRPSCMTTSQIRARKEHACCECGEIIAPGTLYEKITGVWDSGPDTYKTCLACAEIRDHFNCDGFLFEHLWSDLAENFFPDMTAGGPCMEGLSPTAKQKLIDRRLVWYEKHGRTNRWGRLVALPPRGDSHV